MATITVLNVNAKSTFTRTMFHTRRERIVADTVAAIVDIRIASVR